MYRSSLEGLTPDPTHGSVQRLEGTDRRPLNLTMHPNFDLIDLTLTPRYGTRDREGLVRRGQGDERVISRSGIDWSGGPSM